jgi:glycosyltransferase involved in cell wall biosynthesis
MHIALQHTQYRSHGGIENYLLNLVKVLSEAGHQITIYCHRKEKNLPVPQNCEIIVKYKWLPKKIRERLFIRFINKKLDPSKYDLSICLTRAGKQDICICGGTHLGYLNLTKNKLKSKDKLQIKREQLAYRTSKHIIAHSPMIKNNLINLYNIPKEKVTCIYPPSDDTKFYQPLEQDIKHTKEKYKISDNKITLLFPSTGHKRKGLNFIIEALKQLPEDQFECLIAGNSPKNSNLPNNIKYIGYIKNLRNLYASVNFTVLPAYIEPFGLVIIESIACGTPVITSPFVGANSLIKNNGLIMPGLSVECLVKTLKIAQTSKFKIDAHIIQNNELTLENHINKVLDII